jgi:hypothetical protein
MKRTTTTFFCSLIVCALVCGATSYSRAATMTIIKLNLGGTGPDVGMNGAGIFSTVNDGNAGTPGDQDTAIEYTGFLDFIPDITTNTGSFSMNGLNEVGPAAVIGGTLVVQNFIGGVFNLYDPANNLLLSGPMGNSAVTGVLGPPGTGALFTTSLTTVTGGSLQAYIAPGSVSLSLNMTNVNGGAGLSVAGGGPQLNPFVADAADNIAADFSGVPEPTTISLVGVASAGAIVFSRRRR